MKSEISRKNRRMLVVINYFCLVLFLLFFHIGETYGWNSPVIAALVVSFIIALASFIFVHIRTRLWKLVHTGTENLDERQIQITHESLRYSYSIFTVISLLFIMYLVLIDRGNDPVVTLIFASLLYLAHSLPSSILAWKEKDI